GGQRAVNPVSERWTAAVPAVRSGVLDAEQRLGVLELADAIAFQVPIEAVRLAVRMAACARELAVERHLSGVEEDFSTTGGVRLRPAERDVLDDLQVDRVDDRQRVGEVVADDQRLAIAGKGEATRVGLRGQLG